MQGLYSFSKQVDLKFLCSGSNRQQRHYVLKLFIRLSVCPFVCLSL